MSFITILAIVLMSLLSIVCVLTASVAVYIAWRSVQAFLAAEAQKEQYVQFLSVMLDNLQEDSAIFRLEVVKRMGLEIPEVRELNTLLRNLEERMVSFKRTLKEFVDAER